MNNLCTGATPAVQPRRASTATSRDEPLGVPTASLHARFEREAVPLLDLLQRGAMRLTHNRQDAEDLLQDTMLLAYAGFGSFREGSNLPAWMFRIMQNAWISRYRRKLRRPPEDLVGYFTDSKTASQASVRCSEGSAENAALERIPEERVRSALVALREEFRVAVYYADVEGLSYKRIAHITGTPVGTVMSRVYRGRQQLRSSLGATPSSGVTKF